MILAVRRPEGQVPGTSRGRDAGDRSVLDDEAFDAGPENDLDPEGPRPALEMVDARPRSGQDVVQPRRRVRRFTYRAEEFHAHPAEPGQRVGDVVGEHLREFGVLAVGEGTGEDSVASQVRVRVVATMPFRFWSGVPDAAIDPTDRPVLPHSSSAFSRTTTRAPCSVAETAAASLEPPPPTTTTSKSRVRVRVTSVPPISGSERSDGERGVCGIDCAPTHHCWRCFFR